MLSGVWRKSSRSAQGNGGQCVQVRVVQVRVVQVRVVQAAGRAH